MSTQPARRTQQKRSSIWPAIQDAIANMDYQLIAIVATFLMLSIFLVFSASFATQGTYFLQSQVKWVAVGAVALVVMAAIPYRWWQTLAIPMMGLTIVLLVAVLLFGQKSDFGATRTFTGSSFQPSEIAKLGVAIYVAAWVAARGRRVADFKQGFFPFAVIIGLVAGLIILEQSVSMTLLVLAIGFSIYFVGGGAFKQFALLVVIAAPILVFMMFQFGYPIQRFMGWYDVWFRPEQAPQELMEIHRLVMLGNGIGADPTVWHMKSSVFGLWSDFIFANIGADFGVIGMLIVVALFALFGYRGVTIALNAPTRFGSLLAVGLTAWILAQAAIHIGASLNIIPATGQPLPFVSYGGSSLVSCLAAAGVLLSISRSSREKKPANAYFAFRWRHWRPRLPDSGGDRRAPTKGSGTGDRRAPTKRRTPVSGPPTRRPSRPIGDGGGRPTSSRRP
jgi:cell division protein FtsW